MTVHFDRYGITVYHGDCLDVLTELGDGSVDAVVTDPPYGLEFMGKEWDRFKPSAARLRTRVDGRTHPTAGKSVTVTPEAYVAGQPFQQWCQLWAAECLRVLKPGGHLLAFGGTRTSHRLACAIEDAGFEIRDSIAWLYGSGFPKSLDVSKAIDKRPGIRSHADFAAHLVQRRKALGLSRADVSGHVVGTRSGACWNWEHHQFPEAKWWPVLRDLLGLDEDKWGPVIAEAEREKVGERHVPIGHAFAGPSFGGDSSNRLDNLTAPATDEARRWAGWGTALKPAHEPIVVARKPLAGTVAGTVLQYGTGGLNIDGCRVGVWTDTDRRNMAVSSRGDAPEGWGFVGSEAPLEPHTAGRWPANVVLDETQAAALDAQSGETISPARPVKQGGTKGTRKWFEPGDEPRDTEGVGYGDSGGASRFFYTAKAPTAERAGHVGAPHPTVKPLDLMRWLVRLVTPPGGLVLDPFVGSGTTAEACLLEGFRCVAIERDPEQLPRIVHRVNRRRDPVAAHTPDAGTPSLLDLIDGGDDRTPVSR